MPKNSAMGMIVCVSGAVIAFGLVWYMWWLAALGVLVAFAAAIGRGFARDVEFVVPASEVAAVNRRWLAIVAAAQPVSRHQEALPANAGLAAHPVMGTAE